MTKGKAVAKSFMLFHWSPSTRRNGITRYGLKPGCWSIDRLWKPPYVAFGQSPSVAWILSGGHARGGHIPDWDLWMTWSDRLQGYEEFQDEIRVYHRIFKRDVWYVGSRSNSIETGAGR